MSSATQTLARWFGGGLMGLAALTLASPEVRAEEPVRVSYDGQLEDSSRRPVSGIFPLTFNLYRSQKSTRPAWSENHFVAVESGRYRVTLGDKRNIPDNLKLEHAYLGVSIVDGPEILRERLRVDTGEDAPAAADAAPGALAPSATGGRGEAASYAEIAGFAYEAERAKAADAVGRFGERELQQLAEGARRTVTVSTRQQVTGQAGGQGGQPYTLTCPRGYVAIGIQGTAAMFVDSLSVICSPLE